MKKVLAIFILLAYFMVSTGFVVCIHYCMDRFDSAQLGSADNDKCHKCGMHKDGGCCRDEVTIVKLQTTHMAAAALHPQFDIPVASPIQTEFLFTPFRNFIQSDHSVAHSPPLLLNGQDSYIDNCVFRI